MTAVHLFVGAACTIAVALTWIAVSIHRMIRADAAYMASQPHTTFTTAAPTPGQAVADAVALAARMAVQTRPGTH